MGINFWQRYKKKRQKEFESEKYKRLRRYIFARDGYKCALTGKKGRLCMHHIKRYANYPELRWDPRNLITLCEEKHKEITGHEEKYAPKLWKIAARRENDKNNRAE